MNDLLRRSGLDVDSLTRNLVEYLRQTESLRCWRLPLGKSRGNRMQCVVLIPLLETKCLMLTDVSWSDIARCVPDSKFIMNAHVVAVHDGDEALVFKTRTSNEKRKYPLLVFANMLLRGEL